MVLCRGISCVIISWIFRVALAERECEEVDSQSFRFLESLTDFDSDGVYDAWNISDKTSRYPGVYVTEVPCLNDASCCESLERCQYICETLPQCIEFHWYIEIGVFGDVNCDCFLMDDLYLSQASRIQPTSVAGNRTEYSAVCTGDSLTTLDNGEFSALTVDQGDIAVSISIIEVSDADDALVPTLVEDLEAIGLNIVEEVLGEEGGAVYHGNSGEDVLYVVVLGDENLLETDAVQAGLEEYNRISIASGSEHVLNEFTLDQLEKEPTTRAKDREETARRHLSGSESSTHDVAFVFVRSSNSTVETQTTAKLLDRLSVLSEEAGETCIHPFKLQFMERSLPAAQSSSQSGPTSMWMSTCMLAGLLLVFS